MNEYHSQKRDSSLSKCSSIVTTIFLDLDNTLLPTRKIDQSACEEVCSWLQQVHGVKTEASCSICSTFLQRYRQAPAPPGYEESGDEALKDWRRDLWRGTLGPAQLDHLTDAVFARWHACRLQRLQLTDEVQQLLVDLNRDYNIAVITNGPSAAQWEKVRACDLRRLVPSIIVSGDLRIRKPDKAIYFRMCDLLKVSPSECLMVGDKPETDILGAVNAGLAATVLVTAPLAGDIWSDTDTLMASNTSQDHRHPGMCTEPSSQAETQNGSVSDKSRSSFECSDSPVSVESDGCTSTSVLSIQNSTGSSKRSGNSNGMCTNPCDANGTADLATGPNGSKYDGAALVLPTSSSCTVVGSQEGGVGLGHCRKMNGSDELANGCSESSSCCGQASSVLEAERLAVIADFVIDHVLDLPKILPLLNNNNRM